jgi:hypothetical protein
MKEGFGVFKREFGQIKEELRVLKAKTKNLSRHGRATEGVGDGPSLKRTRFDGAVRPTLRGLTRTMISLQEEGEHEGCVVFGESLSG